jgi:hypothetical protein
MAGFPRNPFSRLSRSTLSPVPFSKASFRPLAISAGEGLEDPPVAVLTLSSTFLSCAEAVLGKRMLTKTNTKQIGRISGFIAGIIKIRDVVILTRMKSRKVYFLA